MYALIYIVTDGINSFYGIDIDNVCKSYVLYTYIFVDKV